MAWNAAEVAEYLGISAASFDELRLDDSFPHAEWARDGRELWNPGDVRLWTATHIQMVRQHRRSSNAGRLGT
jgi:predicted DNA-binding transcriptional regulator AlpA